MNDYFIRLPAVILITLATNWITLPHQQGIPEGVMEEVGGVQLNRRVVYRMYEYPNAESEAVWVTNDITPLRPTSYPLYRLRTNYYSMNTNVQIWYQNYTNWARPLLWWNGAEITNVTISDPAVTLNTNRKARLDERN